LSFFKKNTLSALYERFTFITHPHRIIIIFFVFVSVMGNLVLEWSSGLSTLAAAEQPRRFFRLQGRREVEKRVVER